MSTGNSRHNPLIVIRKAAAPIAFFALVVTALITSWALVDRANSIELVEERTHTLARMIVAHGESAINDAALIAAAIEEHVESWDLEDPEQGHQIHEQLRKLIRQGVNVSSAWVLDADGLSRVDTWSFPSKPLSARERPYFLAHRYGATDPVILGDPTPGRISGRQRFTYSRAIRTPDGNLKAIIVVAVLADSFSTLYEEVATWPKARAGLFTTEGEYLARLETDRRASPEFIEQLNAKVRQGTGGTGVIRDHGAKRIVSWQPSKLHPTVYGTSSQELSVALKAWRWRTGILGVVAVTAVLAFALFAIIRVRMQEAREAGLLREMQMREVHHRLKNSLQLISSMTAMQSRKSNDSNTQRALHEVATQIRAVADVEDLLQTTPTLGKVDVCAVLKQLCSFLQLTFVGRINFKGTNGPNVDAAIATSLAIVANELVTNAVKHAATSVELVCDRQGDDFAFTVSNDGVALSPDFDMEKARGFGLRTVRAVLSSLGGTITNVSNDQKTAFRVSVLVAARQFETRFRTNNSSSDMNPRSAESAQEPKSL